MVRLVLEPLGYLVSEGSHDPVTILLRHAIRYLNKKIELKKKSESIIFVYQLVYIDSLSIAKLHK